MLGSFNELPNNSQLNLHSSGFMEILDVASREPSNLVQRGHKDLWSSAVPFLLITTSSVFNGMIMARMNCLTG